MAKSFLLLLMMAVANLSFAQEGIGDSNEGQNVFTIEDSVTWGNITMEQVERLADMASKGHSNAQ
ncbi:MAG: hypothetical protein II674_07385, partial [Prevotella sp.]|nr:hypothetical protein [Prevotella sp.]